MFNRKKDKETMLEWWKDEDDKTILECEDKDGRTPLLIATASGSVSAMNIFVGKPCDNETDAGDEKYNAVVSATDNRDSNVVHIAVETGDVNVLKVRWMIIVICICRFPMVVIQCHLDYRTGN